MTNSTLLPSLSLFTLVIALVIVLAGFLWFLRKRSNRHPLGENEGFENNRRGEGEPRS